MLKDYLNLNSKKYLEKQSQGGFLKKMIHFDEIVHFDFLSFLSENWNKIKISGILSR